MNLIFLYGNHFLKSIDVILHKYLLAYLSRTIQVIFNLCEKIKIIVDFDLAQLIGLMYLIELVIKRLLACKHDKKRVMRLINVHAHLTVL